MRLLVTRATPERPAITCYSGEFLDRTELSWRTLDNGVSKASNMLHDEVDEPCRVAVDLPRHWVAAVLCLAALRNGHQVEFPPSERDAEVVVAASDRLEAWTRPSVRYQTALHHFGMPGPDAPGWLNYDREVRNGADAALWAAEPGSVRRASSTTPESELIDELRATAARLGIEAGSRYVTTPADPIEWMWALPAVSGAAVVIVPELPDSRLVELARAEGARLLRAD